MKRFLVLLSLVSVVACPAFSMVLLDDGRILLGWTGAGETEAVILKADGVTNRVTTTPDGIFRWGIPMSASTGITVAVGERMGFHVPGVAQTNQATALIIRIFL